MEFGVAEFEAGAAYAARLEEFAESIAALRPSTQRLFVAGVLPLMNRIHHHDGARGAAAARSVDYRTLLPNLDALPRSRMAFSAVQRSDSEAAAELYPLLEPQRNSPVTSRSSLRPHPRPARRDLRPDRRRRCPLRGRFSRSALPRGSLTRTAALGCEDLLHSAQFAGRRSNACTASSPHVS